MSLRSAQSSLRSNKSGGSTRESLLEIIRVQQKQNQKLVDQGTKMIDMAAELSGNLSRSGSRRGSEISQQSERGSVRSTSSHKSQFDKSEAGLRTKSYVESVLGRTLDEDVDIVVPQVDGNETIESQAQQTSNPHTPFIGIKGQSNEFTFSAPDSSRRRDRESSLLSDDDAWNSKPEDKRDTPSSTKSQGEGSTFSGTEDQAIGGISSQLGDFNIGEKLNQTSITPENPPNQDFDKLGDATTTRSDLENQESEIDYSRIKIPLSTSNQRTESHSWERGAHFGADLYKETPHRSAWDLRTGFTDPRFQHRLPRTVFEEKAEDFSDEDPEILEQIRTGTRPKTKIGLRDTDEYQKSKNAVTQYKSMITKLCNRLNGSYKTISTAQIAKELEDIECSLDVFQGLCGELLTFDMSTTQMEKIETSFPTYKNKLLDTKVLLTTELQVRDDKKRSKEKLDKQSREDDLRQAEERRQDE